MDRLVFMQRNYWKRTEQAVLASKRLWLGLPLLLRLIFATAIIILAGLLTPFRDIGSVRICLCNLAHGTAWAICMIGGPVYSLAALVGLALSPHDTGLLIHPGAHFLVAVLAAIANGTASYLANKYHQRADQVANVSQLVRFVLLFLVLPVLFIFIGYELCINIWSAQMSMPPCLLRSRMVVQGLISVLLGDLVALVFFQDLKEINEIKAYIFVRSMIFVSASLIAMTLLYNVQSQSEEKGEIERSQAQAANIATSLEHQISLQLRSIFDLEYYAVARWAGMVDDSDIINSIERMVSQKRPWLYVDFYLLNSPRDNSKAEGTDLSSDAFKLSVRYDAPNNAAQVREFPQRLAYNKGDVIPWDSPMGRLLRDTSAVQLASKNEIDSKFLFIQTGDMLQVFDPCIFEDKLVGVVAVGIPITTIVKNSISRFNVSDAGMQISRFSVFDDPYSSLVPLFSNDYSEYSLFLTYADAGLSNGNHEHALRCSVSRNPDSGFFISRSTKNFSIYILFLAIVGAIANALMGQYVLVDDKVRRQLEALDERERYCSNIAHDMTDLLVTLDIDFRILSINPAACAFLGVKEKAVIGRNFHNIAHRGHDCINSQECEAARFFADLRANLADGVLSEEYDCKVNSWLINSQGQLVNFEGRFSVMHRDNGSISIIVVFTNIDAEVKLRSIRSEYVGKLSHDMRTPLSCIKGSIDMFTVFTDKMVSENGFTASGSNMLDVAGRNVTNMQRLINDVLLCDSIDNHTIHLETKSQPIAPIVQGAVAEMRERAEHLNVKLELGDLEGEAEVDELRLNQVLTNLISNAVKYSQAGSTVWIECKQDDALGRLLFSVRDQGKGIPRERHGLIFDRFALGKGETIRKRAGLGLGLTICRGLVHAHGGEIWVDSEVGKGSTFYFSIPILNDSSGAEQQALDAITND